MISKAKADKAGACCEPFEFVLGQSKENQKEGENGFHTVLGLTPYVDFCGSIYLVAQNLTRHDDIDKPESKVQSKSQIPGLGLSLKSYTTQEGIPSQGGQ